MDTQDRKIVSAVLQNARFYRAGDEAALAAILPPADAARLVAKGVLSGDWTSNAQPAPSVTRLDGQPMVRGEDGLIHGDELTGDGSGTPLPPINDTAPIETTGAAVTITEPSTSTPPPAPSNPAPSAPADQPKKPSTKKRK